MKELEEEKNVSLLISLINLCGAWYTLAHSVRNKNAEEISDFAKLRIQNFETPADGPSKILLVKKSATNQYLDHKTGEVITRSRISSASVVIDVGTNKVVKNVYTTEVES